MHLCAFLILVVAANATGEVTRIENRDGRSIEVTVLGVRNETVRVKKTDGQEFEIPLSKLTEESVERINLISKATTPAQGGLPMVKAPTDSLSAAEQKLLADLYPALREWRLSELRQPNTPETQKLKADSDAIINSLAKVHGSLTVKDRCERLLAIIRGRLKGGSLQVIHGALSCLTLINEPEATSALFAALEGNLSDAGELEVYRGLGERCTGKVMEKTLEMFMSSEAKVKRDGGLILADIQTKAQLAELKERAKTVVNTDEAKDRLKAVYALARNLKD